MSENRKFKVPGVYFTLNWYVTKSFFATFFMAIGVLTFGLAGAELIKIFKFLSQGIPVSVAFELLLYSLPHALSFTVPWASLVAIMLLFGRMSADNEITAMRACGISILQIIAPLIVTTFIFTGISLYLQFEASPQALEKARTLGEEVAVDHPLALFTPGRPLPLENLSKGVSIYFSSRDEDDNIYNVQVYRVTPDGVQEDATAARGKIVANHEKQIMQVVLYDARIETLSGDKAVIAFMKEFRVDWNYGESFNQGRLAMRERYLTVNELLARSVTWKRAGQDTTKLEVEVSERVCLALAPIAFLLLGMPLAIRTSRRETSVGLFLSVLLAGVYFANVLCADALRKETHLYPQYLIWIVPFLYQAFGLYYIIKIARK